MHGKVLKITCDRTVSIILGDVNFDCYGLAYHSIHGKQKYQIIIDQYIP